MAGEEQNPRDPLFQASGDPWTSYTGNSLTPNVPLFSREEFETQMNWTRNTIFESSNPLNPTGSSGSNDPLPIVPKANASTRTPLWATFEHAQAARGTFHWNPKAKAAPEVPKLYRTEVDDVEDPHCEMLNNFMRRTQVGQECMKSSGDVLKPVPNFRKNSLGVGSRLRSKPSET